MPFYVSGPASRIYHIVLERGRAYTLCGLKVKGLRVILSRKPKKGSLCQHCERLRKSQLPDATQLMKIAY